MPGSKAISVGLLFSVVWSLLSPVVGSAQQFACVPNASFVADVTVPDDTTFKPGELFEKVWRLKNTGDCAWDDRYVLAHVAGAPLGAWGSLMSGQTVEPGATVDIGVKMQAPREPGSYVGWWQMQDPTGALFGERVYVRIVVGGAAAPTPPGRAVAEETIAPPPVETVSVVDQYYDGGRIGFGVHAGGRGHVAVDDFQIQPLQ